GARARRRPHRSTVMFTARIRSATAGVFGLALLLGAAVLHTDQRLAGKDRPAPRPLRIDPPAIATDPTAKSRYDIVYARSPRQGRCASTRRPARPTRR